MLWYFLILVAQKHIHVVMSSIPTPTNGKNPNPPKLEVLANSQGINQRIQWHLKKRNQPIGYVHFSRPMKFNQPSQPETNQPKTEIFL